MKPKYEIKPHERWEDELTVFLADGMIPSLEEGLKRVFAGKEFSLFLEPLNGVSVTIYFRTKPGDHRLLKARPEEKELVLTLLLDPERVTEFQENLIGRKSFSVHEMARPNSVSNVAVRFEMAGHGVEVK